ncbi:glycosyltransferase family 2 protein [Candidatus Pacearchaeota archaeon]|nr:glycosyltransferase family 2 protein [Candidatus Pacearchaeota archaeon]
MYKASDISVIIPTYNRVVDLKLTLLALKKNLKDLREIIIVDQSTDKKTYELIKKIRNRKVKYVFSKTPSITIARNLGVRKASGGTKIICFIDDDVDIGENYFNEILKVFNTHKEAKGVAAYVSSPEILKMGKAEKILRKIFFLSYSEEENARIISAYGNTYPISLSKVINSEWISGVNMNYLKTVFIRQKFDENLLGYTIAEDIDFSYRLYMKYPNSLFITPYAKLTHRVSNIERYPTEKMSFINQIDHFYFNFKNLNKNWREKVIFIWSLIGISLLRPIKFLISRKMNDYLKMKFYIKSLFYCIKHIKMIKEGILRDFKEK